jgi:hypothetical protein
MITIVSSLIYCNKILKWIKKKTSR